MALIGLDFATLHPGERNGGYCEVLCSRIPWPVALDPNATYLVGRALHDTVSAGVGQLRPSWRRSDSPSEAVYGQVVRVAQLGGFGVDGLERAFAKAGLREAVLVPWGYDPGCQPAYWTASARWIEVGTDAFFRVQLRPDRLWAGRPTLDVRFAGDFEPYPQAWDHGGGDKSQRLTPGELFSLYAALPAWSGVVGEHSAQLLAAVQGWVAEHPGTTSKYPVRELLVFAGR